MSTQVEIDYGAWQAPKPFGISGCFRLRNESEFMEVAIKSHLPYLDEAVLAIQPSDDDTYEIAYRLADEDPKIKVFEYPFIVDWIDTPGFYSKDPNEPGHLVHLSNWALSLCQYSWIAKTEGDVICLSSFANIVEAITKHPNRQHYYGRVLLNIAGEDCNEISLKHPRNGGWDVAVFNNDPGAYKFGRYGKFESIPVGGERMCMGWSGLHTKRCKSRNIDRIRNVEPWAEFTHENVYSALVKFNGVNAYPGIDDPGGADCIYEREWIDYYLENRQ